MKNIVIGLLMAGMVSIGFAEKGWLPLFDGKSLAGWTFDVQGDASPETIWSVEEGIVVVNGKDHPAGVLRTEKSYSNYELEFEWRWPAKPGNSGCLIHVSSARELGIWPKSIEVQLQSGSAGDFWIIGETIDVTEKQIVKDKNGNPSRRRINLTADAEKPAGEWNKMQIITKDSSVEVYVNGTLVNKGWNASASQGAICLQAEKADIQFRNIRIKQ